MARTDNLTNFLTDVASAIKIKAGISNNITPNNFDTEIMNISTIPNGIFIQENTPTKLTNEAFWLKKGSTAFLDNIPNDILNLRIRDGVDVTIGDMINSMTTSEKAEFEACPIHIICQNQNGYLLLAGDNLEVNGNTGLSWQLPCWRIGTNSSCIKWIEFVSGAPGVIKYTGSGESIYLGYVEFEPSQGITQYYTDTDFYYDGNIVIPSNIVEDNSLSIVVDNIKYSVWDSFTNEPWTAVMNTYGMTATASDIIYGKTAIVNNTKLIGTMNNLGDISIIPNITGGNYGSGFVNSINISAVNSDIEPNLISEYIANGIEIFGVTGTLSASEDLSNELNAQNLLIIDLKEQVNSLSDIINNASIQTNEDLSNELNAQNLLIINLKAQVSDLSNVINNASVQTNEDLSNELNAQNLLIIDLKEQVNSLSDIINNASASGGGGSSIPSGTKFGFSTFTDAPNIDTSNYTDMSGMFYQCYNLINVPNFSSSNCYDMSYMFYDCRSLMTIPNFDTSNVTMMNFAFYDCYNLTSVPNFDMSRMFSTTGLFQMCSNLTSVPNFNTSNVEHMSYMFGYCTNLIDVPEFNTSNLRSMSCFAQGCNNLSNATIQNIINMCLNATNYEGMKTLDRWNWESPLYDTIFDASYYENRWMELSAAGWDY